MSNTVLSSLVDGSIAVFGIVAAVIMLVTALSASEPAVTTTEAEDVLGRPGKVTKKAA